MTRPQIVSIVKYIPNIIYLIHFFVWSSLVIKHKAHIVAQRTIDVPELTDKKCQPMTSLSPCNSIDFMSDKVKIPKSIEKSVCVPENI